MNIAISGATGLVGTALTKYLKENGYNVKVITRKKHNSSDYIFWDIDKKLIDSEKLEDIDVVIHLAGENISGQNPIQGRWTQERKKEILESRVKGTTFLSETLANLNNPPKLFISASAIGYYGDRNNETLNENSPKGTGFLSDVCLEWEKSTQELVGKGIRVVNTRFGVILSKEGGALKTMLLPFQMGVGGILGDGQQYMSWIDIDDVTGAIKYIIENNKIEGVVNIVSPKPVTNYEYTKALGNVLNRPTIFPIPKIGINILFGEMGQELLLASQKVNPDILLKNGYNFKYSTINESLNHIIKGVTNKSEHIRV